MSETQPRSQIHEPTPLTKLNILVHPWFESSRATKDDDQYNEVRKHTYNRAFRRFLPQDSTHLLLIMPLVRENETAHQHVERIKSLHIENNWMQLYTRLRSIAFDPKTVRLAPNIVGLALDNNEIYQRISRIGKTINRQTEIILGGEYMDECVESVAKRLLQSSKVSGVKIDKQVSVPRVPYTYDYLPTTSGAMVSQDQNYIYLSKGFHSFFT